MIDQNIKEKVKETKNNLRKLREDKGYTRFEMSQMMHVTENTYWRWESTSAPISYASAKLLAEILDADIDDIYVER